MDIWARVTDHEEGAAAALRGLLADLLRARLVDAVLVPRPAPGGGGVVPAVVSRPDDVADAEPLAPVMPVQGARLVSALTAGGAPYRLGAVLRPCEIRATIELAKLKQADLTGVTLIGMDCLGTYEVPDYAALVAAGADPVAHALAGAAQGTVSPLPGAELRPACAICEAFVPMGCQVTVALIGVEGGALVLAGEELVDQLGYEKVAAPQRREETLSALRAARRAERRRVLEEWRARVRDVPSLLAEFGRCIRCHNCMVACPICYCKECLFRTATFDHAPAEYWQALQRRGALRLPADTLLFHLTRLNHMATSCVSCGACSSACPSRLPVSTLFAAVGEEVQALFGYEPGRSLEEELPLATFREDELPQVAR